MLLRWARGRWARGLVMVTASIVAMSATITVDPGSAEARRRGHAYHSIKKHKAHAARSRRAPVSDAASPRFASIVVDVKSGRSLSEDNADALRHPASITKVMTLYLLFEQLQAGRMSLDTAMPVSAHAAAQAPTKLGLRPGGSLRVDDAIKGMVTRSANDAAVVVAEAIGGSEDGFAALMTRKARALGMSRTTYVNASGLPDGRQITTARDLTKLGMAIQDRFPRYYRYFSTRSFVYRGRDIANHNRLLGRVDGVDGIKTGYTAASGFNLLTSVKRDGRQIVAVVLGGRSGSSRDATMRDMIAETLPRAYAGNRQTPAVGEAPVQVASVPPAKVRAAVVAEAPKPKPPAPVAAPPIRLASAAPIALPAMPQPRPIEIAKPAIASTARTGPVMRWIAGPSPVTTATATPARTVEVAADTTASVQAVRTTTFKVDADTQTVSEIGPDAQNADGAAAAAPQAVAAAEPTHEEAGGSARSNAAAAHTGWIIQIGATGSESAAKKLLDRAQSTGHKALASAEPFTESVEKNGSTLWRARFAGFEDQRRAQAACAVLKNRDFSCMAARL